MVTVLSDHKYLKVKMLAVLFSSSNDTLDGTFPQGVVDLIHNRTKDRGNNLIFKT